MEENKICKCCYSKSGEGVRGGVHGTLDWREGNRQTLISPFVFRPTRLEWFPTQRHSNSWRDLITSLQTGGLERSGGIASQLPNKKWPLWLNPPQTHREAPGFFLLRTWTHTRSREETLWIPVMSSCFRLSLAPWLKMTPWYLVFERTGRLKGGWKRGLPSRGC